MDESGAGGGSRRDRLFDAGALAIALLIGAATFGTDLAGTTTSHADARASGDTYISAVLVTADLIAGLACCAGLLLRRRWPAGLALAIAPVTAFSAFATGPAIVAVFGVAVRRPWRVVAPIAAAYLAAMPAYVLIRPETDWSDVFPAPLVVGGVVGWGMYVRSRHELMRSLAERAERAEAEQRMRVEQARLGERTRIAREMHDVLAHRLSLLSLHAGALEYGASAAPEETSRAAAVIRDSAHQALDELRAVIGVLRADSDGSPGTAGPEPPQPTLGELGDLIDESRDAGMQLEAEIRLDDLSAVPDAAGRHAYRIVQEALTNARRHAPGCAVELRVRGAAGDGLEIEVLNRLPLREPGPLSRGAGVGLAGVAERAALAGGRLEHGRTDGDFRLWAWLPWPA
jgi:signal transduction histidine kinase